MNTESSLMDTIGSKCIVINFALSSYVYVCIMYVACYYVLVNDSKMDINVY